MQRSAKRRLGKFHVATYCVQSCDARLLRGHIFRQRASGTLVFRLCGTQRVLDIASGSGIAQMHRAFITPSLQALMEQRKSVSTLFLSFSL